jgi:hypothetical protein
MQGEHVLIFKVFSCSLVPIVTFPFCRMTSTVQRKTVYFLIWLIERLLRAKRYAALDYPKLLHLYDFHNGQKYGLTNTLVILCQWYLYISLVLLIFLNWKIFQNLWNQIFFSIYWAQGSNGQYFVEAQNININM